MSICAGGGCVNVCPYGLGQHKALCQAQKCSNRQGDILFVYVKTDGNKPDICKWYYNSECNVWFQDFLSTRFFLAFWEYQYQSRYNWALSKEGLSVSIAHKSQSSETQAAPVYQTMGLSFRPIYTSRLTLNYIFTNHSSPHRLSQYQADYHQAVALGGRKAAKGINLVTNHMGAGGATGLNGRKSYTTVSSNASVVIVAIGDTSRIVGASTSLEIGKIGPWAACLRRNVTQVLLRTEQH